MYRARRLKASTGVLYRQYRKFSAAARYDYAILRRL